MAKGRSQTFIGVTGSVGDVSVVAQGEETIMRRRPGSNSSASDGQIVQRSLTGHLAEIWTQMDFETKNLWAMLQQQLGYRSAYVCFSSVSKIAINTGGTYSPTPPTGGIPAALPVGLRAEGTNNGSVFALRILGGPYDAAKVRVFATVAVPALGTTEFKAGAFKPIAVMDNLATVTSIAAEYIQRFGPVAAGGKIGIKVQAVSASGMTGAFVTLSPAIIFAPASAAGAGEDEQLEAA